MKTFRVASVTVLLLAFLACGFARADGIMMPDLETWEKMRERGLINEPEQKAVVFFRSGKEDLIISPSYEGPSSNFAWVVPVPARPKVEILKGALFHELAKLTAPPPPKGKGRGALKTEAVPSVTLIERKTVGAYDVSVLSATDGKALIKWLTANKYYVSPDDLPPIQSYVKERWTFVACRIKVPKQAAGLRTGTLAPLRLTFLARRPIYPIRLSSANPKPFTVLVYLILPKSQTSKDMDAISLESAPAALGGSRTPRAATLNFWNRRRYPTLARLCGEDSQVFVEHRFLRPSDCTKDYVWSVPAQRASN